MGSQFVYKPLLSSGHMSSSVYYNFLGKPRKSERINTRLMMDILIGFMDSLIHSSIDRSKNRYRDVDRYIQE